MGTCPYQAQFWPSKCTASRMRKCHDLVYKVTNQNIKIKATVPKMYYMLPGGLERERVGGHVES